jgi:hypothetical protein
MVTDNDATIQEEFMAEKVKYECKNCGKIEESGASEAVPECCGKAMEQAGPLPVCEHSATAEHSRLDERFGEACDDGRQGKI